MLTDGFIFLLDFRVFLTFSLINVVNIQSVSLTHILFDRNWMGLTLPLISRKCLDWYIPLLLNSYVYAIEF